MPIEIIGAIRVVCDECGNHFRIVKDDNSIPIAVATSLIYGEGFSTLTVTSVDTDHPDNAPLTPKFKTEVLTFCSKKCRGTYNKKKQFLRQGETEGISL
jgi:hypothetical protein